MIVYSIIIPHKNIPHLLRRCLDSIPQREDIEIIVVDDNSDNCYLKELNDLVNKYLEIYFVFTKEGKGAGYARNVGIQKSSGKWLLFPDADDYYTDGFLDALDKYRDSYAEVVCFYANAVSLRIEKNYMNIGIEQYITDPGKKDVITFQHWEPWNKMFRRDYILFNNFRFEEIMVGNDAMFVVKAIYYASVLLADRFPLYNYIDRQGSLSYIRSDSAIRCRFELFLRLNEFMMSIHKKQFHLNLIDGVICMRKTNFYSLFSYLLLAFKHRQADWFLYCLILKLKYGIRNKTTLPQICG